MAKALPMKEIKGKDRTQVQKWLREYSDQLQHLRARVAMSDLKDVRQIRQLRQSIARLKTYLKSLS
jgi:ribosomal protein L29